MHSSWPKDFYFGAATSAHQVEGENRNDWTAWEKANAARLAAEAAHRHANASTRIPDYILKNYPNPLQEENYISGRACDHYNRYEEDFDLAKELGHNAHRFSIEWSRIEPEENIFNTDAIKHYRNVIRALRERGMEPFVTLWHWTLPVWLAEKDGILSKKFPEYFARYAEYVVRNIGSDVTYWMTLNEPNAFAKNAYLLGIWPPNTRGFFATWNALKNLALAHRKSYELIHRHIPNAHVGFGSALRYFEPKRNNPLDRFAARLARFWSWDLFFFLTKKTVDYIAPQYYRRTKVAFPLFVSYGEQQRSDTDWELYNKGLEPLLLQLAQYKKPIYITENGLADARDAYRTTFIREALGGIREAIKSGIDVRGYFHWSLLDNFEWDKGFWPRFGLIEMNYRTFKRKIRPSALAYRDMIKNGLNHKD